MSHVKQTRMLIAQTAKFDEAIKTVLDNVKGFSHEKYRVYRKDGFVTQVCRLLPSLQFTRVEIDEIYPPYTTDAKPVLDPMSDDRVIYRFFRSVACGPFVVFATRDSIDPSGLRFTRWKETAGSTECKECVFAQLIPSKSKLLMVAVVPLRMCAHCSATLTKSYKCARCRQNAGIHVRYCGKECQRAHWKHHRPICARDDE